MAFDQIFAALRIDLCSLTPGLEDQFDDQGLSRPPQIASVIPPPRSKEREFKPVLAALALADRHARIGDGLPASPASSASTKSGIVIFGAVLCVEKHPCRAALTPTTQVSPWRPPGPAHGAT